MSVMRVGPSLFRDLVENSMTRTTWAAVLQPAGTQMVIK